MPDSYPPPSAGPGAPPVAPDAASSNRTIMLILSYLGLLALIPFLIEKNDREVQWHAKHGLVLTAASFVLFVGLMILSMIPLLGLIFALISMFAGLGVFVLFIVAMVKAINGGRLIIPGLSDLVNKF